MKLALAAALAVGCLSPPAWAQTYQDSAGTLIPGSVPLVGCSTSGKCAGPVSATNPFPVTGTFSATLSGFAPGSAYATPLSASTTSSRVVLPAATVVVVYNTGSSAAYVQLGGSGVTATTSADVIQSGSWMAFAVGSNTYLAAITASGSTTLNISGGSGLPTGGGGGGGGGSGGGSVTQGTSPWVSGISTWGGVTVGGASAWGAAPSGAVLGVNADVLALPSLPSGSNVIGGVTQSGGPWSVAQSGSTGLDYSANQPLLPNVGANFAASGPYANYVLIKTIAANVSRNQIDVENTSGAQIAIVLDDGTAASGATPNNASVFAISGGAIAGAQGGSWTSLVERGRVQVYAPASTAQVMIRSN